MMSKQGKNLGAFSDIAEIMNRAMEKPDLIITDRKTAEALGYEVKTAREVVYDLLREARTIADQEKLPLREIFEEVVRDERTVQVTGEDIATLYERVSGVPGWTARIEGTEVVITPPLGYVETRSENGSRRLVKAESIHRMGISTRKIEP